MTAGYGIKLPKAVLLTKQKTARSRKAYGTGVNSIDHRVRDPTTSLLLVTTLKKHY